MTPLRQRMIDDMQLRGLSARTREVYVAAVRQLAGHYRRSPAEITKEELRQYFLYLANEKKVARATATIALCAIRFFYEQTLHRAWTTLRFVRPRRERLFCKVCVCLWQLLDLRKHTGEDFESQVLLIA